MHGGVSAPSFGAFTHSVSFKEVSGHRVHFITFRFAVSPNQSSLSVGKLKVSNKKGWDYLWVRYADKVSESKKNVIKEPVAAYVEQVYPEGDFGNLGLGM